MPAHHIIPPLLLGKCANCLVFGWKHRQPAPLKQCSRCKVLQYCSESCQEEHWKLVHKHHCKKLALAREGEGGDQVGIFSHHPFSAADLPNDPLEALPMLVQKILLKIQNSNQPAFARVQSQLIQIGKAMEVDIRRTWADKKLYPEKFKAIKFGFDTQLFRETASIEDEDLAGQDLWHTLLFVCGRLHDYPYVGEVYSMKVPKELVPEELWVGIQQEMGLFPSQVAELIKALSGTELPSFKELLRIFCSGSLHQACSVCNRGVYS